MVSEPSILMMLCSEVAMTDAEKESEARCKAMLNELISVVKKQTMEMEDLAERMDELAVGLKAIVKPLGAPVQALPPLVPAPTATLVAAVVHAVAAASPRAEAAHAPESPAECSTSGPDPNAGYAKVAAVPLLLRGATTALQAHAEPVSVSSSKSFDTGELDTVTPTRCLTACRGCNTDVPSTYPQEEIRPTPWPAFICYQGDSQSKQPWPPPPFHVEQQKRGGGLIRFRSSIHSAQLLLPPWPPPTQGQLIKELLVDNSSNLQKLAVVGNSERLSVAHGSLGFNLGPSYFLCRHSHGRIYIMPTPVQMQAIPALISTRSLLVSADTGSGKTVSFLVPIIVHCSQVRSQQCISKRGPLAIVLAPTRELCLQVEEQAKVLGKGLPFKTALVVGGDPLAQQIYRIENDCLLERGFRDQVMQIFWALSHPQVLMFSAIVHSEVEKMSNSLVNIVIHISCGNPTRPNKSVKEVVIWVESKQKKQKIFEIMTSKQHFKEQHLMWDPGGYTVQFVKFENVCVDKKMNYAAVLPWFIEWARFKSRSTDLVATEMTALHSFEAFILSKQCKSQCINHGRYCAPDPDQGYDGKDVVENKDNAEHSFPNGTGVQDTINKFSEDCLFSCDNVPSEIPPKDNGIDNDEIRTEVATWLSKNAPHLDDGLPSQPAFSSDRRQDASTSVLPLEPEYDARFSSDFSVDEINNSNVTYLATNATAGEVSAQPNAIVVCLDDIAVTEVDGMINTIGKDKTSENILVKGSEVDSSCQERPQTKIEEGHSAITVEEDPSVNNFKVASKEEIPDEDTESKEQIRLILTNSIEQVSTIKEPINLLGNKESCIEKRVCADGTNGGDLFELVTGGCNLEAPNSVKTQQQTDSTSVAADQLTIPKQTDIEEGQHCPDADEVIIQAVSSIGPAVGAEVMSAGSAANLTKNVCYSEVTTGDGIPEYVSHTSGITFMPSQVDLAELDTYPTSHGIDMVSSKDGVEENRQNVNQKRGGELNSDGFITAAWGQAAFQGGRNVTDRPGWFEASLVGRGPRKAKGLSHDYKEQQRHQRGHRRNTYRQRWLPFSPTVLLPHDSSSTNPFSNSLAPKLLLPV